MTEEQQNKSTTVNEPESKPDKSPADSILAEIWNAEQECRRREAVVEDRKQDLKDAKEDLEFAISRLRQLANSQKEDRPLFDQEEQNEQPVEWAEVSIDQILGGIKGLGAKKKEALIDEVSTLGGLEKLRQLVGRDADHLSKLLPKGIGEEKADEIENAHLDFIANFDHVAEESESVDRDEPATIVDQHPEDAEREKQLLTRLEEIPMDLEGDDDVYNDGYQTAFEGNPITDCVHDIGENQDVWLCGYKNGMEEEEEDQPATTALDEL